MASSTPTVSARTKGFGTTVFAEFSALAAKHGAINLGQGFPDFEGPGELLEAAVAALRAGVNQYAMGIGSPNLRAAIAEHSERFYGQTVDPATEVSVTSGATEALFDAVLGLTEPGDEVILFEPYYDSYAASVSLAGATARFVPLRPPDEAHATWWYDRGELEAAFGERTRLLVLNTPHNPTGKVFTVAELDHLAELCKRHDTLVLADEVYEHLAFEPARHVRMATRPGMWERTLTVSSAGKSFSFTGWKVGWAIGPRHLRGPFQAVHQYVTFATAAPLQEAVAVGLRLPDAYFAELLRGYRERRDVLVEGLSSAGLRVRAPEGSYFALAEIGPLGFEDDFAFARWLTEKGGVTPIPPSAFYSEPHKHLGRGLSRFAFCKEVSVLREAVTRLGALGELRRGSP